jgi:hypothetical protein
MTILAQGTFSIKRAAKDGYSCLLSPETVVLNNDQDGNVTNYSYAKTTVTLLKGETSVAPFIGALSVSGCTAVKSGATVTIASIPQNTKQGYVDIPISYGSFSVTKRFTFQVIDYTVSKSIALLTANGALSLKANADTVDALGKTVSQQTTSIDANAKAISLCVKSTDFESLITQHSNAIDARITSSVSTGGIVKTAVESWFTLSGNTLSLGAASINISGATIFSSLATTGAVTTAIEAIKVGGTNRAFGTSTAVTVVGKNTNNQATGLYYLDENAFGQTVTVSFNWSYTGGSSSTASLYAQLNGPLYTGLSNSISLGTAARSGKSVLTVAIPAYANDRGFYVRTDYMDGTLTISNFKIELGNKATDWSPAPEDIATTLGYTSYDSMVANAVAGKTIITNGHINTELVEAAVVVAKGISAQTIDAANATINNLILGTATIKSATISGALVCTNATFANGTFTNATVIGKITAGSGAIGAFTINTGGYLTSIGTNVTTSLLAGGFTMTNTSIPQEATFVSGIIQDKTNYSAWGSAYIATTQSVLPSQGNVALMLNASGANIDDADTTGYAGNHALFLLHGHISGFRLHLRRITESQTLSLFDNIIICKNRFAINVTFPIDAEDGQPYKIKCTGSGTVNIIAGGISVINDGKTNSRTSWSLNTGAIVEFWYDATDHIWQAGYSVVN